MRVAVAPDRGFRSSGCCRHYCLRWSRRRAAIASRRRGVGSRPARRCRGRGGRGRRPSPDAWRRSSRSKRRRGRGSSRRPTTSAARAPSPPSSAGMRTPSSFCSRMRGEGLGGEAGVAVDRVGVGLGDLRRGFGAGDEIARSDGLAGSGAGIAYRQSGDAGAHFLASVLSMVFRSKPVPRRPENEIVNSRNV